MCDDIMDGWDDKLSRYLIDYNHHDPYDALTWYLFHYVRDRPTPYPRMLWFHSLYHRMNDKRMMKQDGERYEEGKRDFQLLIRHFHNMMVKCSRDTMGDVLSCGEELKKMGEDDQLHPLHIQIDSHHVVDMLNQPSHQGWRVKELLDRGVHFNMDDREIVTAPITSGCRGLSSFYQLMTEKRGMDLGHVNKEEIPISLGEVCKEILNKQYSQKEKNEKKERAACVGLLCFQRWSERIHQMMMDHTPLAHDLVDMVSDYLNLKSCKENQEMKDSGE